MGGKKEEEEAWRGKGVKGKEEERWEGKKEEMEEGKKEGRGE